jgi:hypothetical protein
MTHSYRSRPIHGIPLYDGDLEASVRFGNNGSRVGGTMGKGREQQIILKTDQRTLLLELGLGGKFQAHQADGTSAESFSKAMFLKLQYTMVDPC